MTIKIAHLQLAALLVFALLIACGVGYALSILPTSQETPQPPPATPVQSEKISSYYLVVTSVRKGWEENDDPYYYTFESTGDALWGAKYNDVAVGDSLIMTLTRK